MSAIYRYKVYPLRALIHEVTQLNREGCWRSQNPMEGSSTCTRPILDLIAGGCWARRQLRRSIGDLSVASNPMKLLPLVRVVFIRT